MGSPGLISLIFLVPGLLHLASGQGRRGVGAGRRGAGAGGPLVPCSGWVPCLPPEDAGPHDCLWLTPPPAPVPAPFHLLWQTVAPELAEAPPGSVDGTAC